MGASAVGWGEKQNLLLQVTTSEWIDFVRGSSRSYQQGDMLAQDDSRYSWKLE